MEMIGYKGFEKGLIGYDGMKFELGKIYVCDGIIKFKDNGFHLCKNMEDVFKYYTNFDDEISVCLVKGSGEFDKGEDNYYGYYDMYAFEKLEILKELTEEEIIKYALDLYRVNHDEFRIKRFLSTYKLKKEYISLFEELCKNEMDVLKAIDYYQKGKTNVYKKNK